MVTDKQVKGLFKSMSSGKPLYQSAARADMCENTARKYLKSNSLPSEISQPHTWRTRQDPFEDSWVEIVELLEVNPGLEAKTVFDWLQRENPGKYSDGQLRTLQRRFRKWNCLNGPEKEVFFDQIHRPGQLGASDFTDMSSLGVTIGRQPFPHLIYHFVLTWSNWEHGTICFSESYESLCAGIQNALFCCGGVPVWHRTDRLSAAINNLDENRSNTDKYNALLNHYGMKGQKTNPNSGNENGDVEQRHHRLKRAVDQSLMLRGNRDFVSREEYEQFLNSLFVQLNSGRLDKFREEQKHLHSLPNSRMKDYTEIAQIYVSKGSTIVVQKNRYSVHSRLIDKHVSARIYCEHIEIYFESTFVQRMQRLRGSGGHDINYRHVINWLIRKPGAFANYRYQSDMFPTSQFRIAYDLLVQYRPTIADKEYLKILKYAADESEELVNFALRQLIETETVPSATEVITLVHWMQESGTKPAMDVAIEPPSLSSYDSLIGKSGEAAV